MKYKGLVPALLCGKRLPEIRTLQDKVRQPDHESRGTQSKRSRQVEKPANRAIIEKQFAVQFLQ